MNLWDTAIKYIFFSVRLFFLFTTTGRNKAIIVELKELFVLKTTFNTFSGNSTIRFLAITKNGASSLLWSIFSLSCHDVGSYEKKVSIILLDNLKCFVMYLDSVRSDDPSCHLQHFKTMRSQLLDVLIF